MDDSVLLIKYTMPKEPSQGRGFITKYWRAYYSPILNELKEVEYIMQLLEDVTNQ